MLSGLGWRLVRVWSTDWWHDAPGAMDLLDAALRVLLEDARTLRAEREASRPSQLDPVVSGDETTSDGEGYAEPQTLQAELLGGEYARTSFAGMESQIDPARFAESAYTGTLRQLILRVVAAEAPIRDDLLVERIARAHGFR